jgi:hypothetical protein
MNDWVMKAEYIQPETLIIEMDRELGVICASGNSLFIPGIAGRDYEED